MSTRSEFAESLRALLDDTRAFTREQWAYHLNVTPAAISQWVNDRTIPRPETLWAILDFFADAPAEVAPIVERFYAMADQPAAEVSPRSPATFGPSVADYLAKPILGTLMDEFHRLPGVLKVEFLHWTTRFARDLVAMRSDPRLARGNADVLQLLREVGPDRMLHVFNEAITASFGEPEHSGQAAVPEERLDGGECRPEVKEPMKVRVIPGRELSQRLRNATGLRDAKPGAVTMLPLDSFCGVDDDGARGGDVRARAEVVLWRFGSGAAEVSAFDVDEMIFFLVQGPLTWKYEGAEEVLLEEGGDRLLWMKSARSATGPERGLPPFTVSAPDGGAIGIGIFFCEDGVPAIKEDDRIIVEHATWPAKRTGKFWNYWARKRPELTSPRPETARVPRTKDLRDYFQTLDAVVDRGDPHDVGRQTGQLMDVDFEWAVPGSVLRSRLVRFSTLKSEAEGDLWLGWHDGVEILIPLQGLFQTLSTGLYPHEIEKHTMRCEEVRMPDRHRQFVMSSEAADEALPDILSFPSRTPHGFFGYKEEAYCVLLRILSTGARSDTLSQESGDDVRKAPREASSEVPAQARRAPAPSPRRRR